MASKSNTAATRTMESLKGQKITIPNLYALHSPWRPSSCSHRDIAKEALKDYVTKWVPPPRKAEYMAYRFDELACLMFPNHAESSCAITTKHVIWIFHWDDEMECGMLTDDIGAADEYIYETIHHLRALYYGEKIDGDTPHSSNANGAKANAQEDYGDILNDRSTSQHSVIASFDAMGHAALSGGYRPAETRFYQALLDFVGVQEKRHKALSTGEMLEVAEYMNLRVPDSGMPSAHHFAEYLLQLKLPSWIFDLPEIQPIVREQAVLTQIANDLLSLAKEVRQEPNNQSLIPILVVEHNCTAQAAVDKAIDMLKESFTRFRAAEESLKSLMAASGHGLDLEKFVQAGKDLVMGVLDWSYRTPRYMKSGTTNKDGSVSFTLGE